MPRKSDKRTTYKKDKRELMADKLVFKSGGGDHFPISDVEAALIKDVLVALLDRGCYVAFYTSRDGGAWCFQVMHDKVEPIKVWVKDEDEIAAIGEWIRDNL